MPEVRRPIYLDHHSTTPVDERVLEAMLPFFSERFGNAASRSHGFGWDAQAVVEQAREQVAELVGAADPREIIFTSGATESDNLAIKGVAECHHARGRHVVATSIEHKAVLDSCRHVEQAGFEVTYVAPEADGIVRASAVEQALREDTILVAVMLANNEVGTVQPVGEVGAIARERGILFLCDAVQGVGRVPFDVQKQRVDLAALSAHKIYGPKGIGALYVRSSRPRVRLVAQMDGGGHERALRSGTLNVAAIVGFGKAAEVLRVEAAQENQRLAQLRDRLFGRLQSELAGVHLNGNPDLRLPGNLNVSIEGAEADAVMARIPHIAVSSGSACTSTSLEPSYVLRAMGRDAQHAKCSLRFGLGRSTTEKDIDEAASAVVGSVRELRQEQLV